MCMPLPIAAGATMAAGQLFQGYSAMQQGSYESSMAREIMARPAGFEPATSGLEVPCSIQLS